MNQSLYYRANYCIIVDITLLATATFLTLTFTWWGSLRVRKLHPPGTILAVDESNRKIIGLSTKQSILLCYFSTKLLNICFARLHVVLRVVLRCSAGLTKKQNWTGFNRENLGNQSLTFKSGTFPSVCFEERWHKTALFYILIYIYIYFRKWSQQNAMAFQDRRNKSLCEVSSQPIRASVTRPEIMLFFSIKGDMSRFSLNFLSSSFVIRVNLLHP